MNFNIFHIFNIINCHFVATRFSSFPKRRNTALHVQADKRRASLSEIEGRKEAQMLRRGWTWLDQMGDVCIYNEQWLNNGKHTTTRNI